MPSRRRSPRSTAPTTPPRKRTIGHAVVVAQSLHAESGSFTTDVATLSAYDPTLRFTSGPSNGPATVSYAVNGSEFGAAVRSESGTCWWVKIAASSVTTYGSGIACTGSAAMAASGDLLVGLSLEPRPRRYHLHGRLLRLPDDAAARPTGRAVDRQGRAHRHARRSRVGLFIGLGRGERAESFARGRNRPVGAELTVGQMDGPADSPGTDADAEEATMMASPPPRPRSRSEGPSSTRVLLS